MSIPLANYDGSVFIQTAVSLDQTMVAAWSNDDLVVGTAGTLLLEIRVEDEPGDAAWTPDGRLVTVSTVDPDLVVWTPGDDEEPVVVDVELGTDGWNRVAVADDGKVIAVSGEVRQQGYTLRFGS